MCSPTFPHLQVGLAVWTRTFKRRIKRKVGPTFSEKLAGVPMPSPHEVSPLGISVWHLGAVLIPAVEEVQ